MPLEWIEPWGRFGPESFLTCVGFHSVCLKLTLLLVWVRLVEQWGENKGERKERLHGWVQLSLGFTLCTSFFLILQVMDSPLLACGWAMTRGNRVPFCLPLPSSSALSSPPPLSCCSVKISLTEGHSCVIVMQQGSAAWDDVNETAFFNEKLLWHVLKGKTPQFSTFLSPYCSLDIAFDQGLRFTDVSVPLSYTNGLSFVAYHESDNYVNKSLK